MKERARYVAAMTRMPFLVTPPSLLDGLHPGETIRFTIDGGQRVIVNIAPAPTLPAPSRQR